MFSSAAESILDREYAKRMCIYVGGPKNKEKEICNGNGAMAMVRWQGSGGRYDARESSNSQGTPVVVVQGGVSIPATGAGRGVVFRTIHRPSRAR